jgi:hypothetical protein
LALDLQQTRLYARQIALPAVGAEGQQRLLAATVVVFREIDVPGGGTTSETAAEYLRAAGVGRVLLLEVPADGAGWRRALDDADLALRFALDDDALVPAAIEAGVPLVLGRVADDTIDVLAFRQQGACAHRRPPRPLGAAARTEEAGAAATLLATLAATECLWMLIEPERQPAARLLCLPLDGGAPRNDEIPWPPACPLCTAATAGDRHLPPAETKIKLS